MENIIAPHDLSGDPIWGQIDPWAIQVRRQIHRYPELGLDTPRTQAVVEAAMDELKILYHRPIAHAVLGRLGPRDGPGLLLRADMDGLPITEETGLDFASRVPGRMHACGHDAHTAMLLSAARYLKAHENQLKRPVVLMFQPAEEGPGGALPMLEAGILEHPPVSEAVMVHVDSDLPVGVIGLKSGPAMASPNAFTIVVKGRGGHGAHPDKGVDAIVTAAAIIQACQTLVSREQDPVVPLVVTFGTIMGGYRENVLADRVTMSGTIRILVPEQRTPFLNRFCALVHHIAEAYRAQVEVTINPGYPALVADVNFTATVGERIGDVLGANRVAWLTVPSMGAEDFAYIAQRVPATNLQVGVVGAGSASGIHSPGFILDEGAIGVGARALSALALFLDE